MNKDERQGGTEEEAEVETEEVAAQRQPSKRQKLMVAYLEDCGYKRIESADPNYILMWHWQSHKHYWLGAKRVFVYGPPGDGADITGALSWEWLEAKYKE